jgi:hypothetical protein
MKKNSSDGVSGFPAKDALDFVRKMGVDTTGLEVEMHDIWKMLNEMSSKDPLEYQKFVDSQINSFKEVDEIESGHSERKMRHFRPISGFVFRSDTTAGDGIKIRDAASSHGKALYVISLQEL